MTHPRLIVRALIVGLVSGLLFFPVVGLRSSLAQEGRQGAIAYDSISDVATQSLTAALTQAVQCPQDTIAYWTLNETGGPPYMDSSSNGHHGLCANACPSSTVGQVNGGQGFDGTSAGINIPRNAVFDWGQTNSFSISFWMYRNGSTGRNEVIVGRDDSTSSLHWWVGLVRDAQGRGRAAFILRDTTGILHSVEGTTVLNTGGWHHVVAVREGSAGNLRIYVNGTPEGTTSSATYTGNFASATKGINIGWLDRSPIQYHYGGMLDEVAIYDRALSETDISAQHTAGRAGVGACSNPSIAVQKSADPTIIHVGETVVYSYAVTNDGDVPLTNLNVADDPPCTPMEGPQGGDGDNKLDPGEVWNYTCSMELDEDTTNTVTVSGAYDYPLSGTTSVTGTASVDVIDPKVVVIKTANPAIIYPGTMVDYTYAVTNQGNDTLSNVSISDDTCAPVTTVVGDSTLLPGETQTYACSTIVNQDTTNTATFTGTDLLGETWTFTGQAFVDVIAPVVTVEKTPSAEIVYPGTTVNYTYAVTNQGNDTLSNVSISDDTCAPVTTVVGDSTLLPGETQTYACSTIVNQDTTNTATFTGTDLLGTPWTYTDTAFVNVISPLISVDKTASATAVYRNETVVYTYEVQNPGDDPLSSVSVSDDKCSPVTRTGGDTNGNNKLDPGETWTYTCSTSLSTPTLNKATASGTDSLGNTVSAQDTAFVSVIDPGIGIEKTADKSEARLGEIVQYTFAVLNSGDDPLSDVTVGDNKCSPVSFTGGDTNGNGKLDLGERWTFTCSMAHNSPGATTNTATANGLDSTGRPQSAQDTATVTVGYYMVYLPTILRAP